MISVVAVMVVVTGGAIVSSVCVCCVVFESEIRCLREYCIPFVSFSPFFLVLFLFPPLPPSTCVFCISGCRSGTDKNTRGDRRWGKRDHGKQHEQCSIEHFSALRGVFTRGEGGYTSGKI